MNALDQLEARTLYILREAYARFPRMGLLWSIGKDSTTLLWMARKAFFGRVPFPVIHIDTGYKFDAIYRFRDRYARLWNLDLKISSNAPARKAGTHPDGGKLACCHKLKTVALQQTLRRMKLQALVLGIRRDEHGIRAKERYFSPRDAAFRWNYLEQPAEFWNLTTARAQAGQHWRVHPLLHWTELDVWRYVEREKIPMVDLYLSRGGLRYRSIGCKTCCQPVPSRARTVAGIVRELRTTRIAERSGRAQDKESADTMQQLRSLGYM